MEKEWVSPFFKKGPRDDVIIRAGSPTAISMNEEITAPITVAIVAGYDGSLKPEIGVFEMGNNFDLGLDFEQNEDGEWEMVVKNKQDYEQPGMQQYLFRIQIEGIRITVQIQIINIFDNAPVITAEKNPCDIEV